MLLNQKQAAAYCGNIGVKRFRRICKAGHGPAQFNPDDGRVLYSTIVLDQWQAARDDRKADAA